LTQKNETKKSQDCACFAQKISARTAKSSKLATSLLRQGRFLTLFSLIFWLTRQGQSGCATFSRNSRKSAQSASFLCYSFEVAI
jgi:hypothetical protein